VTTTVTLRPDQLQRLEQLIADTGGSRSSIIRDALDAWMHPTPD
jgi:metal-responsive CopG/Arc/MetJ family transcriptional regulator